MSQCRECSLSNDNGGAAHAPWCSERIGNSWFYEPLKAMRRQLDDLERGFYETSMREKTIRKQLDDLDRGFKEMARNRSAHEL